MRPAVADPYWHDTPTNPSIRVSEVRMAVKKMTADADDDAEVTLVPCPACVAGMVRPKERERLRKIITVVPPSFDLSSTDLDEDDPA